MEFRAVCASFMATHFFRLSADDRAFVFESASTIDAAVTTFILSPMHCDETCLSDYLSLISYQAKINNAAVIVFFNSEIGKTRQADFETKLLAAQQTIAEACERFDYSRIYLISRSFSDGAAMGRLRGLLCDICCVVALRKYIEHPIIIHIDVDTRMLSEKYVDSFIEILSRDIHVKMSSGDVYYGYKGREPIAIPGKHHIPELFVFNEINSAIQRCARNGNINYERRIWFEGCSMAFSLAAYCACGGFDFEKKSGEDDAIGRALHRYNPNAFLLEGLSEDTVFEPDSILTSYFNPDGWMVTDPRRILQAISAGKSGFEAWADMPFMENAGPHINSACLAEQCRSKAKYVRLSDLNMARKSTNVGARKRLAVRLYALLYRSIRYDRKARNDSQIRDVLHTVGFCIPRDQNIHSSRPKIDIENSALFQRLLDLD